MTRKILFSFLLTLSFSVTVSSQTSFLRGIVFDDATGEFLPGVTIFIEGTSTGTITDLDGKFNLIIDPGVYTLRISFISYETLIISGVKVESGEVNMLGELKLKEATIALNEVSITAKAVRNTETALISIKRRSPNLIDGISSGSLKMIGDSDAASAMKRVSGVSVSQGKYVYVRGLGDRYTNTLLNGIDIPGLDPDRNTLQMDIFPASIINNIIVHKTFNAELPADFTGGAIDIEIKDFPDKEEGSFSVGFGYNPGSHFNSEYLTYKGGSTDFLGFDDGTRAIPAIEDIPQYAQVVGNPDGELGLRYKEILGSFNPTMAAMQQRSFADVSLSAAYGNQVPKQGYTLGYNAAISYKNTTDFYQNVEYGRYGLGSSDTYEMERREYQTGSYGENNVLLSGMLGLAIKKARSKLRLNMLHLQNGQSKAGVFDYVSSDQGSDFIAYQHGLDYSQKSLSHLLLDGKHLLKENEWTIEWKLGATYSKLYDPDIRFTRYEVNDDNTVKIGTEVGFPERIWRSLNEINTTASIYVTKAFQFIGDDSKFHFGALNTYKYRSYIIQNFAINPRGGFELSGDPNELFSGDNLWLKDGNVGMGTTYETPFIPTNPNQFNASSINSAAFISTELSFLQNFKATVGLRLENFLQYYTGSDQQCNNVLNNEQVLNDIKLFPTVNLLYQISGDQNLRASYTQTIARPSFKELSYAEIYDPISGITFIGGFHRDGDDLAGVEYWDGNLESTDIRNYDLRWEKFGLRGELVSVGIFYKTFTNPIEIVQYTKQVGAFQPRNVGDGTSYGTELEFRQNLDFLSEAFSVFRVNANITFNRSSIEMSETEYDSRENNARLGETISRYRAMAGQAPYMVNCGIAYAGGRNGFWKKLEAGIYYNVQGPTLEYVGVVDRSDIFSRTFHSLNFNSSIKLGKENNMVLGFKVTNILNEAHELVYVSYMAQEQYFERRMPGTTFTAKFSYKF